MKIALVIYDSLNSTSGGYLYDRKLVEYLRAQGDQVEVVSLRRDSYWSNLRDNFSGELYARLASLDVELLLEDELNHPSLLWMNRRLKLRPGRMGGGAYPLIAIVHHLRSSEARPKWQNFFYRWVERMYLKSVDGFVFNSQTTRRVVEGLVGSRRQGVVAYPAGDRFQAEISPEEIIQRANLPGAMRVLYLGNVIERKRLHTLLEAVGRLPIGTCQVSVVGNLSEAPLYAAVVREQASQLGLDAYVLWRDELSDEQVRQELRQAQVMVVPSSYEGFGIAYLEGMSYGLPAVASSAGATDEVVYSGLNGYLVSPGDAAELAQVLEMLSQDREMLGKLGVIARQSYDAWPGWAVMGCQVRDFLAAFSTGRGSASLT